MGDFMYNKLTEKDTRLLIDGREISDILVRDKKLTDDEWNELYYDFYGLFPTLYLENIGELRYIKELVSKKIDCNFPILICNCDCDFNCTVAVVKVSFCENSVIWERIGFVMKPVVRNSSTFFKNYRNSGIRRVEDWIDEDWQKYGDIAYDLLQDDYFFNDWCSKNWQEELYRRCWGYYHKYFNNDENIDWVSKLDLKFELNEYQKFFCGESV